MADEITVDAKIKYDDGSFDEALELVVAALKIDITTKKCLKHRMTVTTAELALPLGNLTTIGWAFCLNLDTVNFIEIRTGTGGTKIVKMLAGEPALFRFGSGISAPFVIADTANCDMAYLLCAI